MGFSNLYLLQYNNYYNRIVKKEANLSEYMEYVIGDPIQKVNFIPNNYVNTNQIVNWNKDHPDYLIVADENNDIVSRWFVISEERTRNGQLKLSLHRDLVVDFYDKILDAPCFIEKATISSDDPAIFNSENMTFNRIKKKETLIQDNTRIPWICIYAASKNAEGSITTFDVETDGELNVYKIFTSEEEFSQSDLFKVAALQKQIISNVNIYNIKLLTATYAPQSSTHIDFDITITKNNWTSKSLGVSQSNYLQVKDFDALADAFQSNWKSIELDLETSLEPNYDPVLYSALKEYNGKNILVQTSSGNKYYKVNFSEGYTGGTIDNPYEPLKSKFINIMEGIGYVGNNTPLPRISFNYYNALVTLEDITSNANINTLQIQADRLHLSDSPYDMFVLPYGDDVIIDYISPDPSTNAIPIISNKNLSLSIARALIEKYSGSNQIYDAQILPYCPIVDANQNFIKELDLRNLGSKAVSLIKDGNKPIGVLIHASKSSFKKVINNNSIKITIENYKLESECDLYRICSPNYNGIFEFNAAMNYGVDFFNVVCTYKPFTPYIKVYPNFKGLYGSDYNDFKGLICGGDFSLPMTSSAWETFELQNKNYQLTFQREIQNLEINNAVQREQQIWNLVTGAATGAATGSVAGSMILPGIGTAIGAAIGGGSSLAGGIRDYQLSEQLRNETLEYKNDMYGYQLGNIKALPQSLARVSAYNIDNKYFPFIEKYSCTDIEKQALKDKIKYNGMTVMRIGTIRQFIQMERTYIKGKLIRIEGIEEDYHISTAIADEINKGVFI